MVMTDENDDDGDGVYDDDKITTTNNNNDHKNIWKVSFEKYVFFLCGYWLISYL